MPELVGYLDGRWLPAHRLNVPIHDAGFVLGSTATEQLRTFDGLLFRLDEHLDRFYNSLDIIGIDIGMSRDELAAIALEVVERNAWLLPERGDLGVGIFATPGPYATLSDLAPATRGGGPLLCVYAYPLPFRIWAANYREGQAVVVSQVQQISPRSWPPELKCRSRMHYYLADQEASAREPGPRAVLLDARGMLTETTTANVILYYSGDGRSDDGRPGDEREGGYLVSPPRESIIPGISLSVLGELAAAQGVPFSWRDVTVDELRSADEVLLTSTSVCLLPVVRIDGRPVGDGFPGPLFKRLLAAWSRQVGLDVAIQAIRFARPPL